jgi:hypothetical protein
MSPHEERRRVLSKAKAFHQASALSNAKGRPNLRLFGSIDNNRIVSTRATPIVPPRAGFILLNAGVDNYSFACNGKLIAE